MKLRPKTLWRVPVYCVAAGFVSYRLIILLIARFAMVALPDGSATNDWTRTWIIYALVMAAAVLIGARLFRGMTRKEVFASASIIVALELTLRIMFFALSPATGSVAVALFTLDQATAWHYIIYQLLSSPVYKITGQLMFSQIAAFINCFTPYVFVLFAKRQAESNDA